MMNPKNTKLTIDEFASQRRPRIEICQPLFYNPNYTLLMAFCLDKDCRKVSEINRLFNEVSYKKASSDKQHYLMQSLLKYGWVETGPNKTYKLSSLGEAYGKAISSFVIDYSVQNTVPMHCIITKGPVQLYTQSEIMMHIQKGMVRWTDIFCYLADKNIILNNKAFFSRLLMKLNRKGITNLSSQSINERGPYIISEPLKDIDTECHSIENLEQALREIFAQGGIVSKERILRELEVTDMISRMIDEGYLETVRDTEKHGERRLFLSLTPLGQYVHDTLLSRIYHFSEEDREHMEQIYLGFEDDPGKKNQYAVDFLNISSSISSFDEIKNMTMAFIASYKERHGSYPTQENISENFGTFGIYALRNLIAERIIMEKKVGEDILYCPAPPLKGRIE